MRQIFYLGRTEWQDQMRSICTLIWWDREILLSSEDLALDTQAESKQTSSAVRMVSYVLGLTDTKGTSQSFLWVRTGGEEEQRQFLVPRANIYLFPHCYWVLDHSVRSLAVSLILFSSPTSPAQPAFQLWANSSENGTLSIYVLRLFPVTMYPHSLGSPNLELSFQAPWGQKPVGA